LGVEPRLVIGSGGVFDVQVNGGRLVYSKHQTGRFPEHGEILDALRRMTGA
jgi:selT/selW/selH-like putative selenoprotein